MRLFALIMRVYCVRFAFHLLIFVVILHREILVQSMELLSVILVGYGLIKLLSSNKEKSTEQLDAQEQG